MKVEAARRDIFNHAESFSKYIKLKPQARGNVFTNFTLHERRATKKNVDGADSLLIKRVYCFLSKHLFN